MTEAIQRKIERIFDMFPTAFIHNTGTPGDDELILDKKRNVYFRLADIETEIDFDYKVLSYCSFYTADNHFKPSSQTSKYFLNRINRYFRRDFSIEEMQKIYEKFGSGANRPQGNQFVKYGLNLEELR